MRLERFPGRRKAVPVQGRSISRPYTFPAPTGGWVTNQNLVKTQPGTAYIMENWRPTSTGMELRAGCAKRATIGSAPVESFISYNAGGVKKLWACDAENIFDVTSVADPDVPPSPDVSGQTLGYYSYVNFTTSGSSYVVAVNGADDLQLYDATGGAWGAINAGSTPAITGVATSVLSHVWLYRNRLLFIEGGTMNAHYLGVDAIGGAMGTISLAGIFQRGGSLLFGGTWSLDTGDGIDDKCVFITTEGEAAVYEGANPAGSTAAEWNLVGRYDLTPPMGKRATMRAGGDFIIGTEEGMVPISAAISKDAAALSLAAVTRQIEPDWKREVVRRRSLPWEVIKWPEQNYAIVSLPVTSDGQEPWQFVVNLETGKWCKYVGWAIRSMELHNSRLYFGTNDGEVFEAEIGGSDNGQGIYYTYVSNPEHLKNLGAIKTVHQARATFSSATVYNAKISFSTDYTVELPPPPDASMGGTANEWDSGLWDEALWDQPQTPLSIGGSRWLSIGRTGYVFQAQIQITGALNQKPRTEFVQLDVMFENGGVVV